MYCVIQEIQKKKKNPYGYPKELQSEYMQMSIGGRDDSHYYYYYSYERFNRDIMKAYRISIHKSFRENGQVKKSQIVICTVDYYDLAADTFSLFDWGGNKITIAADEFKCSEEEIYQLIEKKLQPLQERIKEEFMQTEEYKTHQEHERITTLHIAQKQEFNSKYDLSGNEYDKCYDVFGVLQNPDYLEKIKMEYEARKRYEEESRRYYKDFYNNYKWQDNSSYSNSVSNTYSSDDKKILKQFYRELSKKFHPDSNVGIDTSEQMKMLNQLKQDWNI